MQFSAVRGADHRGGGSVVVGRRLARQVARRGTQSPTDYDAVFEYGLNALLAPLRRGGDEYLPQADADADDGAAKTRSAS